MLCLRKDKNVILKRYGGATPLLFHSYVPIAYSLWWVSRHLLLAHFLKVGWAWRLHSRVGFVG